MSYFEFPHTRTYDSDLGWLIKNAGDSNRTLAALVEWAETHRDQYAELKNEVDGLVDNLINPIVPWDSSVAYRIYTIVEYQGTNYIAVQDVPVGTMITNTDYWQPANTVTEQINAISISVGRFHKGNVKYYGAVGDGATDDTAAIRAAIADASDIYFPEGNYSVSEVIEISKDITIHGDGTRSIITASADIGSVFVNTDTPINAVEFYGLHFIGNVLLEPVSNYPRRNQTYKDPTIQMGMEHAIVIHGSYGDRATFTNPVHKVSIHDCIFDDIASLPVLVNGIDHATLFNNNIVQNCLDIGFIDCVNLGVHDNVVRLSADNGISVSSGNENVSITGNVVEKSCFHGIWCGGYAVGGTLYQGANRITVTGNTVRTCGYSGIYAYNNSYKIIIADNVIEDCRLKPVDDTGTTSREEAGNGIYAGGVNSTVMAEDIVIQGNMITGAKKSGIILKYVKKFAIRNNLFDDLGSALKPDGTAVTDGDSFYNAMAVIYNYSSDNAYGFIDDNEIYPGSNTLFGKCRFFGVVYAECKDNKFVGAAATATYKKNSASSDILIIDDDNLRSSGAATNFIAEYITPGNHTYTLDGQNGSMYLIATVAGGQTGNITKAAIAMKMSSGVWIMKDLVSDDTTTTYTISGNVLTVTNTNNRNINIGKVSNGIAPISYIL